MAGYCVLGSQSCDQQDCKHHKFITDDVVADDQAGQISIAPSSVLPISSTGPLTEFTLFPSLPFELRILIFEHALPPDDRVIPVNYSTDTDKYYVNFISFSVPA